MMHPKDYQKKLFPYAYNILGSNSDAQDAIQDVLIKYHLADKSHIEDENNYLIKAVINQSINIKKKKGKISSSQAKISLPEPLSTDNADIALAGKDILSYSLLVLLNCLNPRERAVFILKEAFDYTHEEIAQTIDVTIENSRKLLSRAKQKTGKASRNQPSKLPNPAINSKMLEKYITAIQSGNIKLLEKMLSDDITVTTDGGSISIVANMARGIHTVSQLMAYVYNTYQRGSLVKASIINHQPALIFYNDNELANCQVFDFDPNTGKIISIFSIVNPEKLKNLKNIL